MIYDYDLCYYYSDLNHIPCLTDEEQQHLMTTVLMARAHQLSDVEAQAKARLIEGHLALATRIALDKCPPARPHLLPDLVQEASLALMRASDRYGYASGGDFTAYACAYMRGGIMTALGTDNSIGIPSYAWSAARKQGKLDQLRARLPVSLDRLLDEEEDEENSLLATLAAPPVLLPPAPSSPGNEEEDELRTQQRSQVEELLVYLSPLAQEVLRLRYGLRVGDERPRTQVEVARELGSTPGSVATIERDAMKRLRALVSGQATLSQRNGKPCISLPGCRLPQLSPEREATLLHACQRIETEGSTVTIRLLAQETGLSKNVVAVFLQQLRGKTTTSVQVERQGRQARLEAAYARLEAAGKRPSERVLAREAQVDKMTALHFLRAQHAELTLSRRAEQHARRARLEEAYARLEAAGQPYSCRALARAAQVALPTAQRFLRAHHAELAPSRQAERHARQARLEAAYSRLEAAGKRFSGRALAREAQVALSTAQHFLHTPVGCHV